ncbi:MULTISPECIES: hypothetical protein [Providencia]|uniref:hypothetical protein n=1 Tax=Providencia TaxID=586 RepID=UPI0024813F5F|nr:hypothetical protein [Providencia rettgeri]MDU7495877.1 hypothetical protein [Providencia rettgeri]HEM8306996.1 hypothetical protein [Providencia rettgeri]
MSKEYATHIKTREPIFPHDVPFENRMYGGGNGGGDDMQQRIKELEKEVVSMKTDVAVIKSNYATKNDVTSAKNSIILWVVGAFFLTQIMPTAIEAIKVALTR